MILSLSRLAVAVVLATAAALPAPAAQEGFSGAYLGAVLAERRGDIAAAARQYAAAARLDPSQPELRSKAMVYAAAAGNVVDALSHAEALAAMGLAGAEVALILAVEEMRAGAFPTALARMETADPPIATALLALLGGWAASVDDVTRADLLFDRIGDAGQLASFATYHKAMARAVAGDLEAAARLLEAGQPGLLGSMPRALRAWAQVQAATGRQQSALSLLDEALKAGLEDPALRDLRDRIADGEAVGFTAIPNATVGVADALYGLAMLSGRSERNGLAGLVYARLALHLDPADEDMRLELASQLVARDQNALAVEVLAPLPAGSPNGLRAQVLEADALMALGRPDEAIGLLAALRRAHPDALMVATALAQALHRETRWAEAAEAYRAAIALLGDAVQTRHWTYFYRLGMTLERSGQWDAAEAAFRRALALDPEQAEVLNYLGYSLVERGEKLDEAERMIRTAVALRPENGFITDSLAWVLYRLGRFEEAVEPMEKAVALEPTDPILNDHLGDILWMVGRTMEARFQWKRSLSFSPEEKEIPRIRRKLEVGLDRVLEEERAAPRPDAVKPGNGG